MLASVTARAGHPVVAALLGLGAAGLSGAIVAMAWSVHIHQFRLAELLARRQFALAAGTGPATPPAPVDGGAEALDGAGLMGAAGAAAGTTPGGAISAPTST